MPTTASKENAGRLRSFKNKGKDQDVSFARGSFARGPPPYRCTALTFYLNFFRFFPSRRCEEEGMKSPSSCERWEAV